MYVEYTYNSGSGDAVRTMAQEDWVALENAGWKVLWSNLELVYDDGMYVMGADEMPLFVPSNNKRPVFMMPRGAKHAFKAGATMRQAAKEFDAITSCRSTDMAGSCEKAHHFIERDDSGKYVASGPDIYCECKW